ncbi:uncharacterized protein PAE49_009623 [Odontesthes bonariensis]|uniref:uncharacterized protein LOC142372590 n=1 Tax=Odontesthes bonariensis TaxID=219752 RepID=UPI003F585B76
MFQRASVFARHISEECFHNLGQYRTGFALHLKLKPGSVPSLAGPSATHTDQVHSSLASTSSAHVQTSRTRDAACQTDPIVNRTAATPKNVVFPYIGMLCRLYLAAIHFNENANRPQAQTADGVPLFKISFPKSKKGECTVKRQKTKPTFVCMNVLCERVCGCPDGPNFSHVRQSKPGAVSFIIGVLGTDTQDHTGRNDHSDPAAQKAPAPRHELPVGQIPEAPGRTDRKNDT